MPLAEIGEVVLESGKEAVEAVKSCVAEMAQELKAALAETLPEVAKHGMEGVESGSSMEKNAVMSPLLEKEVNKVENLRNVDSWIHEINPNYDPFDVDSAYCNNCGSCAYAVYRRLEGDRAIAAAEKNIGFNWEMEALTGMKQVPMSPEAIRQNLLEQGSGAHAIIGVDRAMGPGHWLNAANIDGKVVAIDGQTGEILDWPPDLGGVVNWEMSMKI